MGIMFQIKVLSLSDTDGNHTERQLRHTMTFKTLSLQDFKSLSCFISLGAFISYQALFAQTIESDVFKRSFL